MDKIINKQRDASELCTRCGLCCILLNAKVYEEEIDPIYEYIRKNKKLNYSISDFIYKENSQLDPKYQQLTINMPCCFLRGTPLNRTFCSVYSIVRPRVCKTYYCKVALRYKLHLIELEEGLEVLKLAYETNNVTLFNWIGTEVDPSEDLIRKAEIVNVCIEQLREANFDDEQIKKVWVLLEHLPKYKASSIASELIFNYSLFNAEQKNVDLDFFIDPSIINRDKLNDREKNLIERATLSTVAKICSLFEKSSSAQL
jgi:Fe-S-cluster containining protein